MKTVVIKLPFGKKINITVTPDIEFRKSTNEINASNTVFPNSDNTEFYDWENTDPFSY